MFKITPVNPESKVRIRNNSGRLVLKVPAGGAELDDVFVKSCNKALTALVEANVLRIQKIDPEAPVPVFGSTAPQVKTTTVKVKSNESKPGLNIKSSGKTRERIKKIS